MFHIQEVFTLFWNISFTSGMHAFSLSSELFALLWHVVCGNKIAGNCLKKIIYNTSTCKNDIKRSTRTNLHRRNHLVSTLDLKCFVVNEKCEGKIYNTPFITGKLKTPDRLTRWASATSPSSDDGAIMSCALQPPHRGRQMAEQLDNMFAICRTTDWASNTLT